MRRVAEMVNSGIQPLQNLSVINKISFDSGGASDGKVFGKDAIVRCAWGVGWSGSCVFFVVAWHGQRERT